MINACGRLHRRCTFATGTRNDPTMAQVNVHHVLESLEFQLSQAMDRAVRETVDGQSISARDLYQRFVRATIVACPGWQNVPDDCVTATPRP